MFIITETLHVLHSVTTAPVILIEGFIGTQHPATLSPVHDGVYDKLFVTKNLSKYVRVVRDANTSVLDPVENTCAFLSARVVPICTQVYVVLFVAIDAISVRLFNLNQTSFDWGVIHVLLIRHHIRYIPHVGTLRVWVLWYPEDGKLPKAELKFTATQLAATESLTVEILLPIVPHSASDQKYTCCAIFTRYIVPELNHKDAFETQVKYTLIISLLSSSASLIVVIHTCCEVVPGEKVTVQVFDK